MNHFDVLQQATKKCLLQKTAFLRHKSVGHSDNRQHNNVHNMNKMTGQK